MEGTPFGRYTLTELLGRGGMGEVWRAYDPEMDRVVALKVLAPSFANDRAFQERFRREARSAAGLDEPHVVPIHDFGEVDGRLYVTMRLIRGRDLHALPTLGRWRQCIARRWQVATPLWSWCITCIRTRPRRTTHSAASTLCRARERPRHPNRGNVLRPSTPKVTSGVSSATGSK